VRPPAADAGGRPTILDVARRAGVSLGTVSNVLNARGNVGEARRASVMAAIASLGYVPNGLAQSLRRQRSRIVGVCVPLTSNAYFAGLLDALERIAAADGYDVMQVLSHHDPAVEMRRVQALIARQVDGLIVVPAGDSARAFDAIAAAGVPAVMVDRATADARFDHVTVDDRAIAAAATRALLEAGHRGVLFVARHPGLVTTGERIRGVRAAVARVPGARATVLIRAPDDAVFAADFAAALAEEAAPTALVVSNSDLAVSVLRELRRLRLRVPRDVSLVTFDAPAWADVLEPPLAVIRPPTAALAERAWGALVDRMRGDRGAGRRIVLEATLERRASMGAAPAASPVRGPPTPGRPARTR
jgi:LacI family transcriptional regulator